MRALVESIVCWLLVRLAKVFTWPGENASTVITAMFEEIVRLDELTQELAR